MRKFGEGTFGRVLECWDRHRSDYVAVKVVRNVQKYRDAAMLELEVLATLALHDGCGRHHCVRLLEWFDYRGHVCMVFGRLGPSLYDALRKNAYRPFPLPMALAFMQQMLEAVAFMHRLSLVHTDLKPENILLVDRELQQTTYGTRSAKLAKRLPPTAAICVIDFGSATFDADYHSTVVSTRHYRAPEIVLGLGWSMPCDIWSAGCILVELLTGDALFQTHENLEHLAMMQAAVGPMPSTVARAAAGAAAQYFKDGRLCWPAGATDKKSIKAVAKVKSLAEHLKAAGDTSIKPYIKDIVGKCCAGYRCLSTSTVSLWGRKMAGQGRTKMKEMEMMMTQNASAILSSSQISCRR
jgi:dual-specificity kinase